MREILSLIQREKEILAIIIRQKVTEPAINAVFHQALPTPDDLQQSLLALKHACVQAGHADAWNKRAFVCLSAREAVFHDFQIPTVKSRVAKKAIPLLLESELPFEPYDFEQKAAFVSLKDKKEFVALITLAPKKLFARWKAALEVCELPGAEIFFSPWPIIGGLEKRKKNSLLLCLDGNIAVMSALDPAGEPLRIGQFECGGNQVAESLARELYNKCRIILASFSFKPEELLFYGPGSDSGLPDKLEETFGLPALNVGEEISLCKNYCRLAENEPGRLVALCMARPRLWGRKRIPVFALGLSRGKKRVLSETFWLPCAAVLIMLCFYGASIFLDALDRVSKADQLRVLQRQELASALRGAPRNASAGRLMSILKSRIAKLEAAGTAEMPQVALKMLNDFHAVIPRGLNIELLRLNLDDRHVRLYGRAGAYEEVNAMKEKLGALPQLSGSRIVSAANRMDRDRGNRPYVEFELDLTRLAQ